jgi:acetyl esterase/lipase
VPRGDGPFPVAVVLHGGYWQATYGKIVTRPLCLDLVARGWAAWNVEYRRLGDGHGGGWPMTFDDVAAAIDTLAALGDARLDLTDVHAVGHSAGGQLALWAAARPAFPAEAPAPRLGSACAPSRRWRRSPTSPRGRVGPGARRRAAPSRSPIASLWPIPCAVFPSTCPC